MVGGQGDVGQIAAVGAALEGNPGQHGSRDEEGPEVFPEEGIEDLCVLPAAGAEGAVNSRAAGAGLQEEGLLEEGGVGDGVSPAGADTLAGDEQRGRVDVGEDDFEHVENGQGLVRRGSGGRRAPR